MKCPKCNADNPGTLKFCGECGTRLPSIEDVEVTETLETPKEELTTGYTFAGRYQIIEELGRGGMGRVYKVLDKETNEKIALKLIKPEIAADKKTVERFRNELTTARKIAQKNVCRMYDLGKEKGNYFITMEYISGQDLKGLIRQTGQLTVGKTISIAKQICDGLTEAHSLGVVHRDLKPNNIMIDRGGNAKIMDFGIARAVKGKSITGSGVMMGTPQYMSPEQVEGKDVDQRSDIYSLGIILYEMLTDRVPFEGDTPLTVGVKQKIEKPRDPKEFNERIPDGLSQLILKCLEKDKENRFQSADELKTDLMNLEKAIPTTEKIVPERKPLTSREITVQFNLRKLVLPGAFVLSLAVIAIVYLMFFSKEKVPIGTKIDNSIAVISFANRTGDRSYDNLQEVIPNLLITNLENTGLFNVLTWERMRDILKQMGVKQVDFIDSDLGFELCRREGIQALAIGFYSMAGDIFTTDVKIYDVETKRILRSANDKGAGAGSIINNQIDKLSREIALGLGAERGKVEAARLNIKDITTPSLEAYNYFLKGRKAINMQLMEDAKENFKKAIEFDPNFAMAYVYLAWAYMDTDQEKATKETILKAKKFSGRMSQKDRIYLEFLYAWFIEQDPERPIALMNDLIQKFPEEKWAFHFLGDFLRGTRFDYVGAYNQFEKWLEIDPQDTNAMGHLFYLSLQMGNVQKAEEFLKMQENAAPPEAGNLANLASNYLEIGQVEKAIATSKEALKINPDLVRPIAKLAYAYALKEDYAEAMKRANERISKAKSEEQKANSYLDRALYFFWRGAYDAAEADLTSVKEIAEEIDSKPLNARASLGKGSIYLARRDFELSQMYFESGIELYMKASPMMIPLMRTYMTFVSGLLALERWLISLADERLAELKEFFRSDDSNPLVNFLEGELLLSKGELDAALVAGERMLGSESPRWIMYQSSDVPLYWVYYYDLIARIYTKMGDTRKAIQEYERLFRMNTSVVSPFLIHPLFHYRLGLLYEKANDTAKATSELEKFLFLWKDADPGMAEVEDAKKRVAGLKGD